MFMKNKYFFLQLYKYTNYFLISNYFNKINIIFFYKTNILIYLLFVKFISIFANMKGLVRISTYAKMVGCTRQNIHDLINRGKLVPIVIDGTIFLMPPKNNSLDNQQVSENDKK